MREEGGGADTKRQGVDIFFFFFEIFFLKKNFFKKDFDKKKKEKGKPSFINLNYVTRKNVQTFTLQKNLQFTKSYSKYVRIFSNHSRNQKF